MNVKKDKPKLSLKLSLKKETLRALTDSNLRQLDAVVGGTDGGCAGKSECFTTVNEPD